MRISIKQCDLVFQLVRKPQIVCVEESHIRAHRMLETKAATGPRACIPLAWMLY
jgi:hypothetical protein